MKWLWITVLVTIPLALSGMADAQRKTAGKTVTAKTTSTVPPLEVRAAREKVQIQHDNVSFWIDKLAPIADALELLDKTYATKPPSPTKLSMHEKRKQEFVQTLRNLREDLSALESEFRTKPALQKYLPTIQGVTDLAAQAEDLAVSGKFTGYKPPLLKVSAKLADTLAVMPR